MDRLTITLSSLTNALIVKLRFYVTERPNLLSWIDAFFATAAIVIIFLGLWLLQGLLGEVHHV